MSVNLTTGLQNSGGFWSTITALGGTAIGAISGTTNHASDAQTAAYNAQATQQTYLMNSQNEKDNKALNILSNFGGFFGGKTSDPNAKPSYTGYYIVAGVVLILIVVLVLKFRK